MSEGAVLLPNLMWHPWCQAATSIITAPWRISPKGERAYSAWRAACDLHAAAYFWLFVLVPVSYWTLKYSVCESEFTDRKPFVEEIHMDPILGSFPCGDDVDGQPSGGSTLVLFNSLKFLTNQPAVSIRWFLSNCWWATPYIYSLHSSAAGAAFIVLPVLVATRLCFHRWWVMGGRTLLMIAWRSYAITTEVWYELVEGHQRAAARQNKSGVKWEFHLLMIKAVLGAVPFRLQVPLTLAEASAAILLSFIVKGFDPPSAMWVTEVVALGLGGAALSLIITAIESRIVWYCSGAGEEAQDNTALGPVFALKSMQNGICHRLDTMIAIPQSIESMIALILLLIAFVVLLTSGDDLVLMI